MNVYILKRTPGAGENDPRVVAWEDICHQKEKFVFVHHSPFRPVSRWKHVDRKKPFLVETKNWITISAHKTLEAAIKAAEEWVSREKAGQEAKDGSHPIQTG